MLLLVWMIGIVLMLLSIAGFIIGMVGFLGLMYAIWERDFSDFKFIGVMILIGVLSMCWWSQSISQSQQYTWEVDGYKIDNISKYIGISSQGHNSETVFVFSTNKGDIFTLKKDECNVFYNSDKLEIIRYESVPTNKYLQALFVAIDYPEYKYEIYLKEKL